MDIKIAEEFMIKLIAEASKYGFEECEASYSDDITMSVEILKGEVSSYEQSTSQGVSFRGLKNGQMGYCETSKFDDEAVRYMLESASENCEVLNDEDREFIYCDENNKDLFFSQTTEAYNKNTYNRFAELGLALEKAILALDSRIDAVDYLSIDCSRGPVLIINSKGLHSYRDSDGVSIYAGCRATDSDGSIKSGGHYWIGNDIDKFDMDAFLAKLSENILGKMGARSCDSGTYKAVFTNEAFMQFMSAFLSNTFATVMQKGLSLLAGREGEKIASECLTLKDVPMYEDALTKVPFDDEGVLTTEKAIIDKGVFATALYNLKSANKAGTASTGNGFKSGSTIGVSPTNLLVVPGEKTFDELCAEAGEGIIITDLSGLHAGVNAISGDFSLLCEGYLIENGKKGRPVEQITAAGNFYEIIKNITAVGSDIINIPAGMGEFFTPSVLVSEVNISGEA
jgi:PmbA protein